MKRRTFLAALAPLIAVTTPGSAQNPLGTALTDAPLGPVSGRLRPNGTPAGKPAAPVPQEEKAPTEITSREAMLDNRIHLATFSGDVEVKDPQYDLTCDKLTVYLKKPKDKAAEPAEPAPIGAEAAPAAKADKKEKEGGGIERAVAEGNVIIVQDRLDENGKKQRYYAKARRAVFDTTKNTCVLTGWPSVSQSLDNNMAKEIVATVESTVITLDQAGIIKVEGLNRVRLKDASALEKKER